MAYTAQHVYEFHVNDGDGLWGDMRVSAATPEDAEQMVRDSLATEIENQGSLLPGFILELFAIDGVPAATPTIGGHPVAIGTRIRTLKIQEDADEDDRPRIARIGTRGYIRTINGVSYGASNRFEVVLDNGYWLFFDQAEADAELEVIGGTDE